LHKFGRNSILTFGKFRQPNVHVKNERLLLLLIWHVGAPPAWFDDLNARQVPRHAIYPAIRGGIKTNKPQTQ
jgi:hypothetical protein